MPHINEHTSSQATNFSALLVGALLLWLAMVDSPVMAQALGSSGYKAKGELEGGMLSKASRNIFPHDVRISPTKHQSSFVVWTGIHRGRLRAKRPVVEHHYFDFAVERDQSVWLSPFGEGDFCLVDLTSAQRAELASQREPFVVVYGTPIVTGGETCLQVQHLRVTTFRWTTMVLEYGPNGDKLTEEWLQSRQVIRRHPEEDSVVRFGYRVQAMISLGDVGFDLDDMEWAWALDLELSRRFGLRNEIAATVGFGTCFDDVKCVPLSLLYRRYAVGLGIAGGPIVNLPVESGGSTWLGFRYAPSMGDALGRKHALLGTAKYDVLWSSEGGWAFMAHLAFGIDGNL
jgi:hypothetical protein